MINPVLKSIIAISLVIFTGCNYLSAQVNTKVLGPADTEVVMEADVKVLPCRWQKKRFQAHITELKPDEKERSVHAITLALGKYPEGLVSDNLDKVFLFGTIRFHGLEYGGTYHKKKIYIANNGIEHGYTDTYIEGTFHHEFSSILLKTKTRYFNKEGWMMVNPEHFVYGDGGKAALQTASAILALDTTLFSSGFLNQYSLASLEEDFNCFAEFLFLTDEGFWKAYEQHDEIRMKTEIIISFFQSLDPIFTMEYFRDL